MGALVFIFGASNRADPLQVGNIWVATYLIAVQAMTWWALPVATGVVGLAQLLKKHIGSPQYWDLVHYLLDELRTAVFKNKQNEQFSERVTLFRHRKFAMVTRVWPWSGWLVPVERSGHLTRKSDAIWRAPDDGDSAEGIAGRVWVGGNIIRVDELPELTVDSPEELIREYASRTFIEEKQLRKKLKKKKTMPRAMCGIPIEFNGQVWGVIVIDSRLPVLIAETDIRRFYKIHSAILNKILSKL